MFVINRPRPSTYPSLCFFFFFSLIVGVSSSKSSNLSYDFYKTSCPSVERIIHNVVYQRHLEAPTTAAGALRLFFHDCFVEGCDASMLIASSGTSKAERDEEINQSFAGDGFDVFFTAKRALELQCPNVVSCADVMAIATGDLVTLGLRVQDMVALSGAHTIGFAHCNVYTPAVFDNAYYKRTSRRGLGLLMTDQQLYADPRTRGYVDSMARDQRLFFDNFVTAMTKQGNVGMKIGSDGEVQRNYGYFNR